MSRDNCHLYAHAITAAAAAATGSSNAYVTFQRISDAELSFSLSRAYASKVTDDVRVAAAGGGGGRDGARMTVVT